MKWIWGSLLALGLFGIGYYLSTSNKPVAKSAVQNIIVKPSPTINTSNSNIYGSPSYYDEDMDCSDFDTHDEAQEFFEENDPDYDPHRLDRDGDGVACETLP